MFSKNTLTLLNEKITKHKVLSSCIFSIIVSSICLFHSGYLDIDNNLISMIVNQCFGTDNYCIFMNYYLCQLVKWIDSVFPYADGFLLICRIFLYISNIWIAYIILSNSENIKKRIILLMTAVVMIIGFSAIDISNSNFTIKAGGIAAVGAISIFAGMHSKKITPYLLMATVCLTLGAMIRFNACMLIIPFILLHIVVDCICSKGKIKKACILIIVPIICIAGIYAVNNQINTSEKYKSAVDFNSARSKVIDYPKKEWEEVKNEFSDITKNDYISLKYYLYGDTDRIDTAYFNKIFDVSAKSGSASNLPYRTLRAIITLYKACRYSVALILFLVLLTCFILFSKVNLWRKAEAICAALGTFLIAVWLSYNGRIMERVCIPMYIMYVILLSAILLFEYRMPEDNMQRLRFRYMAIASMLIAVILFSKSMVLSTGFSPALLARTGADNSKFEKYCTDDRLYVWHTYTLDVEGYKYFAEQGKLPPKEFLLHNISQGEYIYGQVFTEEYFDKMGTQNPVRALSERKNTYYVSDAITFMATYLKEHINPNVRAVKVDTIDKIPVWKFITK